MPPHDGHDPGGPLLPGASGLPHGIPDFCKQSLAEGERCLMVEAGQSLTLSRDTEYDCIGVHGELTLASGATVRVKTFLVYTDGALLCGAPDAPATGVQIIFRDEPLDTMFDPEQFGNGLIGLGRVELYGVPFPAYEEHDRSIVFRSENPQGVRGHTLFAHRADVHLEYIGFDDMGRTSAARPLHSTLFDVDGSVKQIGDNQIGRYDLHCHHLFGQIGRLYQFVLIGIQSRRSSKWGITLHNSSFGLIDRPVIIDAAGASLVEEDGGETENTYQDIYCVGSRNPLAPALHPVSYDNEGRWGSGGWFRGINQRILRAKIRNCRTAIGYWTGCLEMNGPPCGADAKVTIPKFPGADTMDPAQIRTCFGRDGSVAPCMVLHRVGLDVEDIDIEGCDVGIEHWWTGRVQHGSPPIRRVTIRTTKLPVSNVYSDVEFEDLDIDGAGTGIPVAAIEQFNDNSVNSRVGASLVRRARFANVERIFQRTGQLHQAPSWRMEDCSFDSQHGVVIQYGGQTVNSFPHAQFDLVDITLVSGPVLTLTEQTFDVDPAQRVTVRVRDLHAGEGITPDFDVLLPTALSPCADDHVAVVGAKVCPPGSVVPPPPVQVPVDCVVSAWGAWGAWSPWGPSTATTERRTRARGRSIMTSPSHGGAACPALSELEEEIRSVVPVPTPAPVYAFTGVLTWHGEQYDVSVQQRAKP